MEPTTEQVAGQTADYAALLDKPATMSDLQRVLAQRDAREEAERAAKANPPVVLPAKTGTTPPPAPKPKPLHELTTTEKLSRGLSESKPAKAVALPDNGVIRDEARKAAKARFLIGEPGLDRASKNLAAGLKMSIPARGPTKPAA